MAKAVLGLKCTCLFPARTFSQKTVHLCRLASTDVSSEPFPHVSTDPAQLKRGTGGRSSFSGKVVTIFGSTGFLGRAVVNQFGKIGCQVICPTRGDFYFMRKLKLCGDLGQILFQQFSLKDEASIAKSVKYSDIVVNLIGREFETSNFSFEDVHVNGPRLIAKCAREAGVKTLVHFSALNAEERPRGVIFRKGSQFLASKWRGEQAVLEEFPRAIIFRPADCFGPNDRFINYYSGHKRHTFKTLSLWKWGEGVIKQPVFFSDVAKGVISVISNPHAAGQIYQAVGPHRYELSELIDWFHRVIMKGQDKFYTRFDMRFDPVIWIKLFLSEKFRPKTKPICFDRLERDHTTDDLDEELPTLSDLGVELTCLEDRIFYELKTYRTHAYMDPLAIRYYQDVETAPILKN